MRTFLALLAVVLAACAPATDCFQETAFSGSIVSVPSTLGSVAAQMRVQPDQGRPLTVLTSSDTRIVSKQGESLHALSPETQVYVRGVLEDGRVVAQEVRVLSP